MSYQISRSIGLLVEEKHRIAFQNGSHGYHLGFLIGIILAILNLQVALKLPTMFRVNRLRDVGEVVI